jgi:outer membrane protein assembly factor BamB
MALLPSTSTLTCCSKMAVTAVCLSSDDQTAYCVSKDGVIFALDIETGKRSKFDWQHTADHTQTSGSTADWVKRKAQSVGKNALLAIAISFDDR